MSETEIIFPHLGIGFSNVPRSFTVFGVEIALYGIIITCGMLLAVLVCSKMAEREGLKGEEVWNSAIWCIVFCIIGARIYYVIFSWDAYKDNLLQIFNLRAGGLAFYGGLIAAALTLIVYMRRKSLPFLRYADVMVHGILIGQIMGRWGNFTNREAFGGYTDSLFAMRLPLAAVRASDITPDIAAHVEAGTNYIQVHPTFLYESAWNLCLLVLMLLFTKKKMSRFDGERMWIYLGGYGLGRCLIEGLRTDQLRFPGTEIAVSQVLGGALFLAACAVILTFRRRASAVRTAEAENTENTEEKEEEAVNAAAEAETPEQEENT